MSRTAPAAGTVTVNAAFLQELKDVNLELWQLLAECRRYCEQPLGAQRPCTEFVQRLGDLCDKLAMHFALEEAYGYFDDPLQVPPRLSQRCGALRGEHGSLYVELVSLVEQSEQLLYERKLSVLANELPPQFARFHQRLMDHEACEMELIQEVFADDIGEGD